MNTLNNAVKMQMTELLKREDISQADLARKTHISKATVSKMFTAGTLSAENAVKIAKAYKVTLEFLYGLEGKESLQEYAIDTIGRHLKAATKSISFGKKSRVCKALSVSTSLSEYLEKTLEAEQSSAPCELKNEWLQFIRNSFLTCVDDADSKYKEYALIETKYLSDTVLDEIDAMIQAN